MSATTHWHRNDNKRKKLLDSENVPGLRCRVTDGVTIAISISKLLGENASG
jgi:hypothetical protein